jgi:Fe-S oxidoreductase
MDATEHTKPSQPDVSPAEKIDELRKIYRKYTSRKFFSMLNACVNCGMCAEACHYYCSENNPDYIPANRIKRLSAVISEYFHPVKSKLPFFKPQPPMANPKFDDLFKSAFENCTMCGKCALTCPMGINTGEIMYVGRALLYGLNKVPSGLIGPVKTTLETGNYLGISNEDFIETVEWLAEEMEDDMGEGFKIPIDKQNAKVLYIPHPLTLRDLPYLLMAELKILAAAGEDYTLSTHDFNVVNYAYYQGSKENAFKIASSTLNARKKLNAESIVMAPCGHGFRDRKSVV